MRNTPFMLNYGQNPTDPTIKLLRERNKQIEPFVGRWSEQLSLARSSLLAAQQRQKAEADKHRRESPDYQPGDEVLLSTKYFRLAAEVATKLAPRWVRPFKIVEAIGPYKLAYKIELPQVASSSCATYAPSLSGLSIETLPSKWSLSASSIS